MAAPEAGEIGKVTRPGLARWSLGRDHRMKPLNAFTLGWLLGVATGILAVVTPAKSQHHHPAETITGATAEFYETWKRPDMPSVSCCNQMDCYATPARFRNGRIEALHRESSTWIEVPPQKVEMNRNSPDGRNHLCASPQKYVFCFVAGGGT
jgi:hypothetical protein